MNPPDHPLRPFASIEALGVPGATGRWQPTRAGAVNSWAWADEQFLFADGWLAFAGPNGSGKSLSASMLITVLLDADTSQTALSTDEKAAGTLTSRHTDRSPHQDRTGAWWLEYGRRDPDTGQIQYLTTGLWLRATSSDMQRAYFINQPKQRSVHRAQCCIRCNSSCLCSGTSATSHFPQCHSAMTSACARRSLRARPKQTRHRFVRHAVPDRNEPD